jgi:UDP-N-acetylenolpyruvoylglucosamine reductase
MAAGDRHALEQVAGDAVQFDVPTARFTSLRVGGPADAFATPPDRRVLAALLTACALRRIPHLLLGNGFNTVVRDGGVAGLVIRLARFRLLEERPGGCLRAEAGVTHASLTRFCRERGLAGLEFGAGIPGTVGGWIAMNAGVPQREVKDVVRELEVMSPTGRRRSHLGRAGLRFEYRGLRGLAPGSLVLSALLAVRRAERADVEREIADQLAKRADSQPIDQPPDRGGGSEGNAAGRGRDLAAARELHRQPGPGHGERRARADRDRAQGGAPAQRHPARDGGEDRGKGGRVSRRTTSPAERRRAALAQRRRRALWAAVFVAGFGLGATLGPRLAAPVAELCVPEVLRLRELRVVGNEHLSAAEVAAAAGLEPNARLDLIEPELLAARIEGVADAAPGRADPRLAQGVRVARAARAHGLRGLRDVRVGSQGGSDEDSRRLPSLRLVQPAAEVLLGGGELDAKLERLTRLLAAELPEVLEASAIDLRFGDRMVLRSDASRTGDAATWARGSAAASRTGPAG